MRAASIEFTLPSLFTSLRSKPGNAGSSPALNCKTSAASMALIKPSPFTSPSSPGGVDVGVATGVLVGRGAAVSVGAGEGGIGSVGKAVAVSVGAGEGGIGSVGKGVAVTLGAGDGGIGSVGKGVGVTVGIGATVTLGTGDGGTGSVGGGPFTVIVPRMRPG